MHDIDLANPLDRPKARDRIEKADAMLVALKSERAVVEELLAKAEAILQDFQPSGVTVSKPDIFQYAIAREDAAAFIAVGQTALRPIFPGTQESRSEAELNRAANATRSFPIHCAVV